MFAVEIVAVFVREGLPAFGADDIWEDLSHPLRMAFDFAYDFTGLMVLIGCVLALLWRLKVQGTAGRNSPIRRLRRFYFCCGQRLLVGGRANSC